MLKPGDSALPAHSNPRPRGDARLARARYPRGFASNRQVFGGRKSSVCFEQRFAEIFGTAARRTPTPPPFPLRALTDLDFGLTRPSAPHSVAVRDPRGGGHPV